MATDATGTPSTKFSIPKFDVANDAPSGLGGNAQIDFLDTLLDTKFPHTLGTGLVTDEVPVYNGTTWVYQKITRANMSTTTRNRDLVWVNALSGHVFADAVVYSVTMQAVVPDDYASGDITVKLNRRAAAVVGGTTAVMDRSVFRVRNGTAPLTIDSGVAIHFTDTGDTNTHQTTHTIAAANFQVGDTLVVVYTRTGTHASDNYTNSVIVDGTMFEYTGYV